MAPKTYRNCGQWILTDHHGQLVFAGQKLDTGQSPLSILDGVARRLLVPQMRRARQYPGDRPLAATGVVDGRTWATRVHRVHCPISDRVLGVLGAYFPVGDGDLGDPPLVAAWAHPVKPVSLDGPLIPSFWTPDLFTLTGIDPSTASRTPDGRCVYPVQQVTTEVVHPEDRHSTLVALDRFYWDETDALRTHSLRIQTDVVRYVRWAGRRTIIPEAPLGEQCWAGGPVHALTRQQYLDSNQAAGDERCAQRCGADGTTVVCGGSSRENRIDHREFPVARRRDSQGSPAVIDHPSDRLPAVAGRIPSGGRR